MAGQAPGRTGTVVAGRPGGVFGDRLEELVVIGIGLDDQGPHGTFIGLDLTRQMLAVAHTHAQRAPRQPDTRHLPLPDASVDAVAAFLPSVVTMRRSRNDAGTRRQRPRVRCVHRYRR